MAALQHSEDGKFLADYPKFEDLPPQLDWRKSSTSTQESQNSSATKSAYLGTPPTSTETSPTSSPLRHALSGTQPMNITSSPAQGHFKPAKSGLQTSQTESRPAQEPSNPTNSGIQTAQTTSRPTKNPRKKTTRIPLTAEQKLDRHKRAEAVRRNRIGINHNNLRDEWTPVEFRLPVNKWHNKKESLIAAGNWLEELQQGNDELENTLNAFTDVHGLLTEGYPTAQMELLQHQGLLPHTPPLSQSPPNQQQQQPAAAPQPSFPDYLHWDHLNHQPIPPPQQTNPPPPPPPPPPPQPTQGFPYYHPVPQDNYVVLEEDFMGM